MGLLDYQITQYPFKHHALVSIQDDASKNESFPVVYIIYDHDKLIAYIGETTNSSSRLKTHLSTDNKKLLKHVVILSSKSFNKSAVLDIESFFIQYMPSLGFRLLNGNAGMSDHNYYQKETYRKIFEDSWKEISFNAVKTKPIWEIENTDLFKYSPYKSLSQDQVESIVEILTCLVSNSTHTVLTQGLAGSGKTILAIYLCKLLASAHQYDTEDLEALDNPLASLIPEINIRYPDGLSIGVVVPMTSLRATLRNVFGQIHGLKKSMVIGPNDVVKKQYDLLIVDEAHRLTRRKAITNYKAFDDVNIALGLHDNDNPGTQLDWILRSSEKQVLFYDEFQSIKPADVRVEDFQALEQLSSTHTTYLKSQMRSKGGTDYIEFVRNLFNNTKDLPVTPYKNPDYELKLYNCFTRLIKDLRAKETTHGLCRLVSGYSWKWISNDNAENHDIEIEGVQLTWNRESKDWINSTTDVTEMGCIHTVQGYDLNYVAVIIGEEFDYDPISQQFITNKDMYFDKKGKAGLETPEEFHGYILNIYKTLMLRGIKGTYLYIYNEPLRTLISQYIEVVNRH